MGGRGATQVASAILVAAVLGFACGGGSSADLDDVQAQAVTDRRVEWAGGSNTTIGGSLTLPATAPLAGVLIVPGFGAIDRDQVMVPDTADASADRLSQDLNYSRPGVGDPLFKDLADAMAGAGLASLRYDKRASGRSQVPPTQALSFDDLVADARGGLDLLAKHRATSGRPLFVLGHDQGGLVAMRLARHPGVRAVALVSTFGRLLDDVIGDDLRSARGPVAGQAQSDQLHAVAASLRAGGPLPRPEDLIGNLRALLLPFQEAYLRSVFSLDPVAEARSVRVPALVVRGTLDTTSTAVDADRLLGALPAGSGQSAVADADHNLRVSKARTPAALADLVRWLAARAGP